MRILIDECLDWRLCRALSGHDCTSVQRIGGSGFANGALLARAEQDFDVFITADSNLSFQQPVARFNIAIVVLHAQSTQLSQTQPLMPKVAALIPGLKVGEVVDVYP